MSGPCDSLLQALQKRQRIDRGCAGTGIVEDTPRRAAVSRVGCKLGRQLFELHIVVCGEVHTRCPVETVVHRVLPAGRFTVDGATWRVGRYSRNLARTKNAICHRAEPAWVARFHSNGACITAAQRSQELLCAIQMELEPRRKLNKQAAET